MLDKNNKIFFISGPTAIGKSSIAIRLANKINGMIINADSMQVYSNLEIITARPNKKDQQNIKHELYGYKDGSVRYNVAVWCNDIMQILNKNEIKNIPSIIVGGTGMYIDSLLNGLINIPNIPETYKKESEKLLKDIGLDHFVRKILDFDEISLKKISINDSSRLRRIWEVYKFTGKTYSDWLREKNKIFLKDKIINIILFLPPREKIYNNINKRFLKMIELGAIEEVKKLNILNLDKSLPIMRAHGVPEISKYLQNNCSLESSVEKAQQVTRNYAKRQLTWWRSSTLTVKQVFDQLPNEINENMIKI